MSETTITPQADKVRRSWRVAEDAYSDVVTRSEEYMRYVLNDPYTAEDKANAKKWKKPLLKYSIMIPYLAILIGNEQLSRRRALIKTRSNEPEMIALIDIIQGRWNAINDEQDVEEKIQTAFSDALIMPVGGYIVRSFEMNEEGYLDFKYDVANNMRIKIDPETKSSDYELKNCRWIIKEGWERPEVLKDKYNIAQEDFDESGKQKWWEKINDYIRRFRESGFSSRSDGWDEENDLYRILEMQERTMNRVVRFSNGQGIMELPAEDYKKLKSQNPQLEYLGETEKEIIHITTIIPALNDLLVKDEDSQIPTNNFDVFKLSSYSFTNQVTEATSLVGLLKDIQDDINKGKSQNRDYLSQILAGTTIVYGAHEKDMFEKLSKQGNQPSLVVHAKNPNSKVERLQPQQVQPDILINTSDSLGHGDRIAQSTAAMRGETERSGESGRLFDSKVDRAAAAINPYFKNVSNLRKMLCKDFVDNFAYVYAENDRTIDIKTKGDGENATIWDQVLINLKMASETINDVSNASMYVELDEGEDNLTTKEDNFNKLMAIAEVVGNVNPAYVDIKTLLKAAPIKGMDKWLEYIEAVQNSQADEADAQNQIDKERQRLENAGLVKNLTESKTSNQAQA